MFLLRPFTFHYELIITLLSYNRQTNFIQFTFHYELIITVEYSI